MLARKRVRAQAEAERKGVDQVQAAQERLRKMQGVAKSSSTNAAAKNMFIERLKVRAAVEGTSTRAPRMIPLRTRAHTRTRTRPIPVEPKGEQRH